MGERVSLEAVVDAFMGGNNGHWRIWDEDQCRFRHAEHEEVRAKAIKSGWLEIVNMLRRARGGSDLTELPPNFFDPVPERSQ